MENLVSGLIGQQDILQRDNWSLSSVIKVKFDTCVWAIIVFSMRSHMKVQLFQKKHASGLLVILIENEYLIWKLFN